MGHIDSESPVEQGNNLYRMVTDKIKYNARDIKLELDWFNKILKKRSSLNTDKTGGHSNVYHLEPPEFDPSIPSDYSLFIEKHGLGFDERFALVLALIPHVRPELLDIFMQKNKATQRVYTQFGGTTGKHHIGYLPTGETAMYILAGSDTEIRFSLCRLFDIDHVFYKENVLWLEEVDKGEPYLSGALTISREIIDLFTIGEIRKPNFSSEFPAKLLSTQMEWEDLVLHPNTEKHIEEIEIWLEHHNTLMNEWGMGKKLKPGYKVLFYGPPGTGKTLTATLIGKKTGKDVYKIDLSAIVSKFIGETEKNLAKIFDRAENKDWILFFDEADALFGKRTSVNDAHDKYANQEVSYLLQRIEDYAGLVILASNMKDNIDDAFTRRFQGMAHFPMPNPEQRFSLWEKGFSQASQLEEKRYLRQLADNYELSGGSIMNVVQYSSLMSLKRGTTTIYKEDLLDGIKKEYHKAKRTL